MAFEISIFQKILSRRPLFHNYGGINVVVHLRTLPRRHTQPRIDARTVISGWLLCPAVQKPGRPVQVGAPTQAPVQEPWGSQHRGRVRNLATDAHRPMKSCWDHKRGSAGCASLEAQGCLAVGGRAGGLQNAQLGFQRPSQRRTTHGSLRLAAPGLLGDSTGRNQQLLSACF